ncbi:MAG: hypothetical protein AB1765_01970 [Candidatus Hydrogenedentota bacterium]
MSAVCALHYWVLGLLRYCVFALSCFLPLASFVIFLFRYLASCFYLISLELQCFSEEEYYNEKKSYFLLLTSYFYNILWFE